MRHLQKMTGQDLHRTKDLCIGQLLGPEAGQLGCCCRLQRTLSSNCSLPILREKHALAIGFCHLLNSSHILMAINFYHSCSCVESNSCKPWSDAIGTFSNRSNPWHTMPVTTHRPIEVVDDLLRPKQDPLLPVALRFFDPVGNPANLDVSEVVFVRVCTPLIDRYLPRRGQVRLILARMEIDRQKLSN
jgi:hypothetical protein